MEKHGAGENFGREKKKQNTWKNRWRDQKKEKNMNTKIEKWKKMDGNKKQNHVKNRNIKA
jgi:hypothetical protein